MTPQQFGQLALQLLAAAQIPGEALDAAMQFKTTAKALADGQMAFVVDGPAEPVSHEGGQK